MATNKKPTVKKPEDLVSSVAKDLGKATAASKQSTKIAKDIASVKIPVVPATTSILVGGNVIPVNQPPTTTSTPTANSVSPNIPFIDSFRPASPTDSKPAVGVTAPEFLPPEMKKPVSSEGGLTRDKRDAYALVRFTFQQYGLEELVPAIEDLMKNDVGPREAEVRLKTDPKYNKDAQGNPIGYAKRFAGNTARTKAGLNALSESEYLALEDSYSQVLKSYGQQSYLGTDTATKRAKAAELIAADMSPVELKDRVDMAVNRVENADPNIKKAFKMFYPGLQDSDLVSFLLAPRESLPQITEKVKASEIAGAAMQFGFMPGVPTQAQISQIEALPEASRATTLQGLQSAYAQEFISRATELARSGVDRAQAVAGYQAIAGGLEQGQKIAQRFGGDYTLKEAEAEIFQGNVAAEKKRKRFASLERAAFGGQTGVTQGALGTSGRGSF